MCVCVWVGVRLAVRVSERVCAWVQMLPLTMALGEVDDEDDDGNQSMLPLPLPPLPLLVLLLLSLLLLLRLRLLHSLLL